MAEKQVNGEEFDDGGAAAEDAAAEHELRELPNGEVEVSLANGEERTARHDADEHEEAPTHDATGREYSEEERDALRASRRDEKKRRRNAAREREDRLRETVDIQNRTISEMQQRLSAMEQRGNVGELQQLDNGISEATNAAKWFRDQMAAAIEAKDGTAAADFSAKMTQASMRAEQLTGVRQNYLNQAKQPPPLDPRQKIMADTWMAKNPWYDPRNTADPDVRVMLALDDGLHKSGNDPTSQAYWDKLTRLAKQYLPHRYKEGKQVDPKLNGGSQDDDDDEAEETPTRNDRKPPPRSPTAGGGAADNNGTAGTFRLSAARVDAMKQAGIWNDPKRRASMIERYRATDRENARNARR